MFREKFSTRQRLLLYTALDIYNSLVKTTKAGLEALNLATIDIDTAESRSGLVRHALETTKVGEHTEFTAPLQLCATEALSLYYKKTAAKEKELKKLQVGTENLEETLEEIKKLAIHISKEPGIFDDLEEPVDEQTDLGVDGKGNPPPKASQVQPLAGVGQ